MQVGTIEGEVNTSNFKFRATEEVKKFDFISVKSNEEWILAQVEEVTKKSSGETFAQASIIGYRDKGLTKAPRRVIEPDSIVYQADQELISDTLGLDEKGLRIGTLETNPKIDIHVDQEDFYKHFAVLAQTGAGKSYFTAVLVEELLEKELPILILDPHGEYSSLQYPNSESDKPKKFDVQEFSPNTDINQEALPLQFSSLNLSKKELMTLIPDSLTNSQMGVLYNSLKRLKEKDEDYTLLDIEDAVSQEDSTAKWNLLNYLEQLEESGLFSQSPIDLEELVEPGRATVINLRAVEPETTEMTAYMLAKKLFDMRKENRIPPFLMVMEEAHNFAPEKGFGQTLSNDIMRKIASEGRKFGLGIGVISQRPARIDKNVLSQCNNQFILRVTNPNDLKAISKSFEGVTSEVESMIKSLPPGVCFALGNEYPVMTDVRTRKSQHGGETQTADNYTEKTQIDHFKPRETISEVEETHGEKFTRSYYPFYLVEGEEKKLVDAVKNQVKASRPKISGRTEKVYTRLKNDKSKQEVAEEIDTNITKIASDVEKLQEMGFLEGKEVVDSLFNLGTKEESVEEDEIIEIEVDENKVKEEYEGEVSLVYYPYYSSGEIVYDPMLQKEVE